MMETFTASLGPDEFSSIRQFIYDKASIVLEDDQHYLVESRLAPVMEREGVHTFRHLIDQLQHPSSETLRCRVVNAITTNETYFFRDVKPFNVLRDSVLPQLIERRRIERQLRIFFGGCSSGQEPYSVAMMLRHNFPALDDWDLRLTAVDISGEVIRRAIEGSYTQFEVNRGLPAALLVKYFERQGLHWRVKQPIREMIEFRQASMTDIFSQLNDIDIVFLRNILIYFDEKTRRFLLQRVEHVLRSDGYLIMGAAEAPIFYSSAFETFPGDCSNIYCLKPEKTTP
jgi:chemotaxis protein methyltransferase CheR